MLGEGETGMPPSESTQERIAKLLKHPLMLIVYYTGTIALALVFDAVKDTFDHNMLLLAALVVGIAVVINMIVGALVHRTAMSSEIDGKVKDLAEIVNAQHLGWIVNDKYIRSLEYGSRETWVFSQDLCNDIEDNGEIAQAVRANLREGNKYRYFLPKAPVSYRNVAAYIERYRFESGQVRFYLIPDEVYLLYTEVVVYNLGSKEELAVEWLPQDELNYYVAMDKSHTAKIIGIGHMFIENFPEYLPLELRLDQR